MDTACSVSGRHSTCAHMCSHAGCVWAAARTCSPPGDHDGEDASIDGEHGDEDVGGRGEGAHDVGPDAAAVQQLHEQAQAALQQRAVLAREHDLEVALCAHMPPFQWPCQPVLAITAPPPENPFRLLPKTLLAQLAYMPT